MIYLIHFLDEWLDFRYSEFFSLLEYHGYHIEDVVFCCTANQQKDNNNNNNNDDDDDKSSSSSSSSSSSYDLSNYQHLPKKEMLAYWEKKRYHASISSSSSSHSDGKIDHFMLVEMPSDQAILEVCSRAILIKGIYHLWSMGATFQTNVENTKTLPSDFLSSYLNRSDQTWSIQVLTFGRTFTMEEKQTLRLNYSFLTFQGRVNLKTPDMEFWIIVDYSSDIHAPTSLSPNFPTFFGRRIGGSAMKCALQKFDLKKRPYLGPTSLDDSLAFILANLGYVGPGMTVFEPFMGTGSIGLALAHFGAFVLGADIDPRVLKGDMYAGADQDWVPKGNERRDVRANFEFYGLPIPELVRMDAHLFDRHLTLDSAKEGLFQAIVTDPPYGIRAGARKSGRKGIVDYSLTAEQRVDHIPSTQTYAVEEVMLDLLHNAARSLVMNGRLVYLIPTTYDFTINDLPRHPCLVIEDICHQPLSARHGRRAVIMRKHRAWSEEAEVDFLSYKQSILSGQDDGFGLLMGKLQAALAGNAYENENVVKKLSNCGERRRQSKEFRRKLREAGLAYPVNPNSTRHRLSKKELKRLERQANENENGQEDEVDLKEVEVETTGEV